MAEENDPVGPLLGLRVVERGKRRVAIDATHREIPLPMRAEETKMTLRDWLSRLFSRNAA